jgi:hypothetical protein
MVERHHDHDNASQQIHGIKARLLSGRAGNIHGSMNLRVIHNGFGPSGFGGHDSMAGQLNLMAGIRCSCGGKMPEMQRISMKILVGPQQVLSLQRPARKRRFNMDAWPTPITRPGVS